MPCVDMPVKLEPCAAVTCLQTQLTRTALSQNSCPHLFQCNVIIEAQKVSDLLSCELLEVTLLHGE